MTFKLNNYFLTRGVHYLSRGSTVVTKLNIHAQVSDESRPNCQLDLAVETEETLYYKYIVQPCLKAGLIFSWDTRQHVILEILL